MIKGALLGMGLAMIAWGCDSSEASVCEEACNLIEEACMSTTSDCVDDCSADLDLCPDEMGAVLACVLTSELECDPEQDQGLAEAPCEEEHDAAELCGSDPF